MNLGNNAKKLCDTLNNSIAKLNDRDLNGRLHFFGGNFIEQLKLALFDLPYSNVAVIYSKESFDKRHEETDKFLKANGNTFKNIVLDENDKEFFSNSDLLHLEENVRAIVCMDSSVFDVSAYFANYYGSRLIENVTTCNIHIYNSIVYTKENRVEFCRLFIQRYIIVDAENFELTQNVGACLYATLMENIVSLVDYGIFCEYTNHPLNSKTFERFSDILNQGFNIFSFNYEKRFSKLLALNFELLIINQLEEGKLLDLSAVRNVSILITDPREYGKRLMLAKKIIAIYDIACKNINDGNLFVCDCNDRISKIQRLIDISQDDMINCYTYQNGILEKCREKYRTVFENIGGKINFLCQSFNKIILIFNALGGDTVKLNKNDYIAIKYAGDIFECFNGLTLIRDNGILESI